MATDVQPPRGMRDFLPEEKARREAVLGVIRDTFAAHGYREIETPAAEELGRLQTGDDGDNGKLIYRILRRGLPAGVPVDPAGAADLGLRFDLTVPLARFYATHRAALPDVFRSVQIAPVWRAERPQKGRYRQFVQCDIDVLNEPGIVAEVELLAAAGAALDRLGLTGVSVRVNDRRVLRALLDSLGFPEAAQPAVLVSLDKLDKIGPTGVADELATILAVPSGASSTLVEVLAAVQQTEAATEAGGAVHPPGRAGFEVLDALPAAARAAAEDLVAIRDALDVAAPDVRVVADPTLVRGQGYYTGPIFELRHPAVGSSIGGGGRYDGMIGRLSGHDVPACGFSFGFERLVELVDAGALTGARRRLAVVHDAACPAGLVVAWQRSLVADGADVRLVRRIRNTGRLLAELEADGVEAWLDLADDAPLPGAAPPALRPLGRRGEG